MKAALCIGGEMPGPGMIRRVAEEMDIVAAADSGFDALYEIGIEPDLVLGDMDSTNYRNIIEKFPSEKVHTASRDKDETDTEIGLRELYERGVDRVTLIGGGGGRLDHLLGLIILFHRDMRPHQWYTRTDRVVSVEDEIVLEGLKGTTVSLFPAGKGRCRIHSEGLKWPLDDLVWNIGDAGISNLVTGDPLILRPIEGRALFVCPCEAGS
jgi:thiamine pyrophosphokinase